ncbi:MAG: glycoside hydrolase family 9 protein [Candidatus Hydrogenedentes bacterium]|nr:glycoside hydrolase family 9 protein [Candidatus Hydrogenedentota bacterium]
MRKRARIGVLDLVIVATVIAWPAWTEPVFTLSPEFPLPPAAQAAWEQDSDEIPALRLKGFTSATVPLSLFDAPQPILCPGEYRIETWAKLLGGKGQVKVVLYHDAHGAGGKSYKMPLESGLEPEITEGTPAGWRYFAQEVPIHGPAQRMWFNILLYVEDGDVLLRALKLQNPSSCLVNGDFDQRDPLTPTLDDRSAGIGDVGLPRGWRRHYEAGDTGRQAAGRFWIERRGDGNALIVQKEEGAFVLVAEPVTGPFDAISHVTRARAEFSSEPPVLVVRQYGADGLLNEAESHAVLTGASSGAAVISTEAVPFERGAERLLVLIRFPEKEGAYSLRAVELLCREESDPRPVIRLNQTGYATDASVRFIVESEVFTQTGTFALRSPQHTYEGKLVPVGRAEGQDAADWGKYYFEGRVSDPEAGIYHLSVRMNGHRAEFDSVTVAPKRHFAETAELAYRFYSVQRCGCEVPGWHGPCHLDDGRLPDGTHADVTGGYHNAGDYHKHTDDNTPVSVYAMVDAYEGEKGFFDALDHDGDGRADLLDEAMWGAEWMLKMIDPKTGHSWRNITNDVEYRGIPERDTDGVVNTSDDRLIDTSNPVDWGSWNIAGFAALSRHVPDPRYLQAAVQLWAVNERNLIESREPRALVAAIELYRTTHDEQYARAADQLVANLLRLQDAYGWYATAPGGTPSFRIVDEGVIPAALALYVLAWPEAESARAARESIRQYFKWSLHMADNPFGIIRHRSGEDLFYFKSREEWFGGSNSAYCSTAWAARVAARVFQDEPEFCSQLREHAANQLHWILGMNPLGLCMFEGKGDSSRIRYHHTYSTIPGHERGAVPGIIPNGIIRDPSNDDRPWFDLRSGTGSPVGAESAEPWLPHNAFYLLALAASD